MEHVPVPTASLGVRIDFFPSWNSFMLTKECQEKWENNRNAGFGFSNSHLWPEKGAMFFGVFYMRVYGWKTTLQRTRVLSRIKEMCCWKPFHRNNHVKKGLFWSISLISWVIWPDTSFSSGPTWPGPRKQNKQHPTRTTSKFRNVHLQLTSTWAFHPFFDINGQW